MVAPAQPRQPGLMANMASTAAGVAVGSAVVSFFTFFKEVISPFVYSFPFFLNITSLSFSFGTGLDKIHTDDITPL